MDSTALLQENRSGRRAAARTRMEMFFFMIGPPFY
jgi:hypothetical protein